MPDGGYRPQNIRWGWPRKAKSSTTTPSRIAAPPVGCFISRPERDPHPAFSKVGLARRPRGGYRRRMPTSPITGVQPLGYRTGQFGEEPLRATATEHLRRCTLRMSLRHTLYHLNARGTGSCRGLSPRKADYPNFKKEFGSPGCVHCWRQRRRHPSASKYRARSPRKRMGDGRARSSLKEANASSRRRGLCGEPFFVWSNNTHLHFRTMPRSPGRLAKSGALAIGNYHDVDDLFTTTAR